ncbi:MAG TPA: hypothetical protein VLF19_03810 [Methylomirabilota bacterium]|nr:hypothetical protein [Methylomirabilota bacterium]
MTVARICTIGLVALVLATACAKPIPARVVKDVQAVQQCQYVGLVSDTDYVDLARKAGEVGGTHALIIGEKPDRGPFGIEIGKAMVAEVFRCPSP